MNDAGKYVGVLLSNQDKYLGKFIYGSQELYSFQEMINIISEVSGKKIIYTKISREKFAKFFPPAVSEDFTEMFEFYEKYGYWGKNTTKLVAEQSQKIFNAQRARRFVSTDTL